MLRQGVRHEHVLVVVLICIASEVAGAGSLFTQLPWLVTAARWGGAVFLLGHACLAAHRALRRPAPDAEGLRVDPITADQMPRAALPATGAHRTSLPGRRATDRSGPATLALDAPAATTLAAPEAGRLPAVVGTVLAMTWLNPHVYLDTLVLLGSVGSSHGQARWAFAAGAILGSTLWFAALGLAARALAPVFARPIAWRVLDGIIAVVMSAVAAGLLVGT